MTLTPEQLKGRIRNIAKDNNADARILLRIHMMERLLERVSVSNYRNNFIIKGGMLITALVGVSLRSTMDIDTSLENLNLSEADARRIITEIKDIDIEQVAKCNKALVEMCDRFYNSRLLHNPTPEQAEKYLRLRDYVKSGEHVTVFFDRELKKVSKNERKEFYNNLKGQIVAQFENENPKNIWKDKLRDFLFDANGRISVAPEHVSRR